MEPQRRTKAFKRKKLTMKLTEDSRSAGVPAKVQPNRPKAAEVQPNGGSSAEQIGRAHV